MGQPILNVSLGVVEREYLLDQISELLVVLELGDDQGSQTPLVDIVPEYLFKLQLPDEFLLSVGALDVLSDEVVLLEEVRVPIFESKPDVLVHNCRILPLVVDAQSAELGGVEDHVGVVLL